MKRKGLTLVEILLSVAIISVSAVIIVKVFVSASTINDRTRDHDEAVFFSVSTMEEIHYENISFLFSEDPDPSEFDFLEGYEVIRESDSWLLKKVLEDGLFASVRFKPEETSVTVGIEVRRNQSPVYELSKVIHRRQK